MANPKDILNAILKSLIAGFETSALVKVPATFISQLASLPIDEKEKLAKLDQDQFTTLMEQLDLVADNTEVTVKQNKALLEQLLRMVENLQNISQSTTNVTGIGNVIASAPGATATAGDIHVHKHTHIHPAEHTEDKPTIQNLPYPSIGDLFRGRGHILRSLKNRLKPDEPTAITQAIKGLGGIGKSRLAVEFGWWTFYNDHRPGIFFISAETPKRMYASIAALASEKLLNLGTGTQDEQLNAVFSWLNANPGWLMIIDNADDEKAALAVENLLPSLAAGYALITSRYTRWSASIKASPLKLFEPDTAKKFLLDRTKGRRIVTDNDTDIASQLAEAVGYLPLALEQASAYIAHTGCTFADYLSQWQDRRKEVLEWYDPDRMKYPASVVTTWQRTFDVLGPTECAILHLASFLASEPIPAAMFRNSSELVTEAAELLATSPASSAKNVPKAFAELGAYSMITRTEDDFNVHRIVQDSIRLTIPSGLEKQWVEKAINMVNDYIPDDPPPDDVRSWHLWIVMEPHVESITKIADKHKIVEQTSILMNDLANYLDTRARYEQAEPLYKRALKIAEEAFGKEDTKLAVYLNNLAALYYHTNRLEQAEKLYKIALEINEEAFGEEHHEVASNLNNLALLFKATNRLEQAEPLYKRALKINKELFGLDHPEVAKSLNNLAEFYRVANRLEQAEKLFRRALQIRRESLGKNHPDYATSLNDLGNLLKDDNRLNEAETLLRQALKVYETSLGKHHPWIATVLNNLATLLLKTNRQKEALRLMERAVEIYQASSGPDHPNTIKARGRLEDMQNEMK